MSGKENHIKSKQKYIPLNHAIPIRQAASNPYRADPQRSGGQVSRPCGTHLRILQGNGQPAEQADNPLPSDRAGTEPQPDKEGRLRCCMAGAGEASQQFTDHSEWLTFCGFVSGCEAWALSGRAACTKPLLAVVPFSN